MWKASRLTLFRLPTPQFGLNIRNLLSFISLSLYISGQRFIWFHSKIIIGPVIQGIRLPSCIALENAFKTEKENIGGFRVFENIMQHLFKC